MRNTEKAEHYREMSRLADLMSAEWRKLGVTSDAELCETTAEQLGRKADRMAPPAPTWEGAEYVLDNYGDVWRHRSGGRYCVANGMREVSEDELERRYGPCCAVNLARPAVGEVVVDTTGLDTNAPFPLYMWDFADAVADDGKVPFASRVTIRLAKAAKEQGVKTGG